MAKKYFMLMEVLADEQPDKLSELQHFLQNYQTALFLSLVDKKLLTQWQFDRCVEELQKQSIKIDFSVNKSAIHYRSRKKIFLE